MTSKRRHTGSALVHEHGCNAKTIRGGGDPAFPAWLTGRAREWARLRGVSLPMRIDCIMVGSWIRRIQGCGASTTPGRLALDCLAPSSAHAQCRTSEGRTDVPLVPRLAPCSPRSRTLRAGSAGAASAILDSVCARRSADRQVGTKGWPSLWSNKGMGDVRKEEQVAIQCLTTRAPYKPEPTATDW